MAYTEQQLVHYFVDYLGIIFHMMDLVVLEDSVEHSGFKYPQMMKAPSAAVDNSFAVDNSIAYLFFGGLFIKRQC